MKNKFLKFINTISIFIVDEENQKHLKKLNLILSLICIFFVYGLFLDYKENYELKIKFNLLEVIIVLASYLLGGYLWSNFMKKIYKGDFNDYFFNWSFSKIGKFLPSGLLTITVRLNQNNYKKKSSKEIFIGVFEEQFLFPLISIPAISFCIIYGENINTYFLFLISVVFIFYFFKKIYFKLRKDKTSIMDFPISFITLIYLSYISIVIIADGLGYQNPDKLALLYFLSSSLGLFFVGIPSGIGIREIIFFTITRNSFLNLTLFELIVKIRILYFLVDLLFGTIGFINIYFLKKNS